MSIVDWEKEAYDSVIEHIEKTGKLAMTIYLDADFLKKNDIHTIKGLAREEFRAVLMSAMDFIKEYKRRKAEDDETKEVIPEEESGNPLD